MQIFLLNFNCFLFRNLTDVIELNRFVNLCILWLNGNKVMTPSSYLIAAVFIIEVSFRFGIYHACVIILVSKSCTCKKIHSLISQTALDISQVYGYENFQPYKFYLNKIINYNVNLYRYYFCTRMN